MRTILGQFEEFARSKPPHETFDYFDRHNCACAQFAEHIGMKKQYLRMVESSYEEIQAIFVPLEQIAVNAYDWTWGGVVKEIEHAKQELFHG